MKTVLLGLLSTVFLFAAACNKERSASTAPSTGAAADLPPDTVVATVSGQKITAKELDEKISAQLSQIDEQKHNARKQGGQGIYREQKTQGRRHCKERQDIPQLTTNIPAVKRSLMVFPMKRVESLVKKAANQAFAGRKAAVKKIFHKAPHRDAC